MYFLSTIASSKTDLCIYSSPFPSKYNEKETMHILCYRQDVLSILSFLKLHSLTRALNVIDLCVVDYLNKNLRFKVSYYIQSLSTNSKYAITIWTSETKSIISVHNIFPAFNWLEREVWDLYGLMFVKHSDLRRILTDYGFSGHPLRKDFPLSGFKETQYTDITKQVEYTNVELSQAMRVFKFQNVQSANFSSLLNE